MKPKQLELPTWGGRRKGAVRKARGPLRRVSHKKRPVHAARFPLHAVLRTREDVPRLRRRDVFRVVREALECSVRAVHYSVQGNHIHLVVEAVDARALSRGMQGLAIRVARAVNRAADVVTHRGMAAEQGGAAPDRALGRRHRALRPMRRWRCGWASCAPATTESFWILQPAGRFG